MQYDFGYNSKNWKAVKNYLEQTVCMYSQNQMKNTIHLIHFEDASAQRVSLEILNENMSIS